MLPGNHTYNYMKSCNVIEQSKFRINHNSSNHLAKKAFLSDQCLHTRVKGVDGPLAKEGSKALTLGAERGKAGLLIMLMGSPF